MIRAIWARAGQPLPRGTLPVGAGLAVTTIASYAFLVLSARILGPTEYGLLAVLWSMVYIASGVFSPLEQEVSRALSARHAVGVGGGPVVRRAAALGGLLAVSLGVVTVAAAAVLGEGILRGDAFLVGCLLLGLVGHSAARLFEGILSGTGRFGRYGLYLAADALIRLLLAITFIALGVTASWPYGLALAVAPLLAIMPILWRIGRLTGPGPEAPWREISIALGTLLASSVLASTLLYAPAILVESMSDVGARSQAGVFNAALVLARLPLIFFAAVHITLLPQLSSLAAARRDSEIPSALLKPLLTIVVVLAVGCVAALSLGPQAMSLVYGEGYEIGPQTLGVLAVGSSAYIVAMTLAQGLIAIRALGRVAASWGVGLTTMLLTLAVPGSDVPARVGLAYVTGSTAAALAMGVVLLLSHRSRSRLTGQVPVPDTTAPPLA